MADTNTPLLYDHWYMAGWADEFDEGLHERTLLSRSLVIFRKENGELAAIQNRCAHRSYPLAAAKREGDILQCVYHGAKFDADGNMVAPPPGQPGCPKVKLRSYAMRKRGPIAWIFMGEPELADESMIPASTWLDDPSWVTVRGLLDLEGNWILLAENLMDLTHVPFVHGRTFNYPLEYAETPIKLVRDGDTVSHARHNAPGYHRSCYIRPEMYETIEEAGVSSLSQNTFVSPALCVGKGEIYVEKPEIAGQSMFSWRFCNLMTPVNERLTKYWYTFSRNYDLQDQALTDQTIELFLVGLVEDKVAIENVQRAIDADTTPFREAHFKSDAAGVTMRRIVKCLAERELSRRLSGYTRAAVDD